MGLGRGRFCVSYCSDLSLWDLGLELEQEDVGYRRHDGSLPGLVLFVLLSLCPSSLLQANLPFIYLARIHHKPLSSLASTPCKWRLGFTSKCKLARNH